MLEINIYCKKKQDEGHLDTSANNHIFVSSTVVCLWDIENEPELLSKDSALADTVMFHHLSN